MPLKLIGAGLGRTGTMSLKAALDAIGYGPCYHMSEVFGNPDSIRLWEDAADGRPDWEAIFKGYVATVDYPACSFWRELSAAYPKAKVLLSVRDPKQWFESTQATIFSPMMNDRLRETPMKRFFEKTVWKEFGERISDQAFMVEAFRRHTAEVEWAIPKDRLLVYDVKEGWEPLCRFLGVAVPATPFPRVNTREELAQALSAAMASAGEGSPDMERLRTMAQEHARKSQGRDR
jgi:hypothetical protein